MVFIQNYTVDPHSRRLLVVKVFLKLQVRGVGGFLIPEPVETNGFFSHILSGMVRRG